MERRSFLGALAVGALAAALGRVRNEPASAVPNQLHGFDRAVPGSDRTVFAVVESRKVPPGHAYLISPGAFDRYTGELLNPRKVGIITGLR